MTIEEVASKNFNSIKVRLKRIFNPVVSVAFEFQFHKGTIKT